MPAATQQSRPVRYTVWSVRDRRLLVALLGYLALASSLTANIYFPLIELLAARYEVTTQAINLTITLFIVFQGIVPSFWSPLSDAWGRRPVYLATFTVYTLASMGLSIVDRNYPALLILRAMQSIGSSAVVSLAYATVSDVIVHSERGKYLAPMLTTTNLGNCIGPVVGGGIALVAGDPRWCFRVLLIFGASATLLIGWIMPETGRPIVGNGAVPAKGIWMTWWNLLSRNRIIAYLRGRSHSQTGVTATGQKESRSGTMPAALELESELESDVNIGKTGKGRLIFPNPLPSLRIVFYPDTFLVLWLSGCPSALLFCVQTSISPIFTNHYGFNPLEVGLCFLTGGVGIIAAGFVAGRLMDWNYKHVAKEAGFSIDRVRGDDINNFPIERARSRGSIIIILVSLCVVIGYGWVVEANVHPSVPLILQACILCKCATLHQIYGALIVDIFPEKPGTAAASKNITRCVLAGLFVAVLDPLVKALGYGWFFTLIGLLDASTCILAVLGLNRWGREWRNKRS
jgi:MFS family permease